MYSLETVVQNPTGLHARPAAQLAGFCKQFPNEIQLSCGERSCNPKSVLNLLRGCFKAGDTVTIAVDGEDAPVVAQQIITFINQLEG